MWGMAGAVRTTTGINDVDIGLGDYSPERKRKEAVGMTLDPWASLALLLCRPVVGWGRNRFAGHCVFGLVPCGKTSIISFQPLHMC
jgi:hypothetical protein